MRIIIWLICLTLFICWVMAMVASVAYAGTAFTQLTDRIEIVDMDEYMKKEEERAKKLLEDIKGAYVFSSSQEVQQP
jgi:hypothetical protein